MRTRRAVDRIGGRARRPAGGPTDASRMIDREKVLVVLRRRFPAARAEDIAAAANAIVGLDPEYEPIDCGEVRRLECEAGAHAYSAVDLANGRLRLYRRLAVRD